MENIKRISKKFFSVCLVLTLVMGMVLGIIPIQAEAASVTLPNGETGELITAEDVFGRHGVKSASGYKYYLTYNGTPKADDCAYWVDDKTGLKYPAFCVSPTKAGVTELGPYDVNVKELTADPQFYWILRNGYPYKSIEELGVSDEDEAYAATKFALWSHLNNWDLSKWAVNPKCSVPGDHSDVLAALKKIVAAAQADEKNGVPDYHVSIIPETPTAVIDPNDADYYSQTFYFEYDARIDPIGVRVEWKTTPQAGMKITKTDSKNTEAKYFKITEKFKVLYPKELLEEGRAEPVGIAAFTQSWIRPAMQGYAINLDASQKNAQNYLIATPEVWEEKVEVTAVVEPVDEKPRLVIEKQDDGSGNSLKGARFSVKTADGDELGPVTTSSSGRAEIWLPGPGTYVVKETKAPKDYILDDTPRTVVVAQGQETAAVNIPNGGAGSLQVKKVDAVTGETLEGAVIRLTHKDTGASQDLTTNEAGNVNLNEAPTGWYDVQEIQAPPGYILDSAVQTIKVEQGKTANLVLRNRANPGLKIIKLDEETKEPLPGATFEVSRKNGTLYGQYTTDHNGEILIRDMPLDWYTVKEISAPDGYIANTESQTIQLETNKTLEMTFLNRKKPVIEITKLDSQTGRALAGAEIEIHQADGAYVGVYMTDNDGKIELSDLEPGAYVITEITAPEGYLLDDTHHTVQVLAGETAELTLENVPKPGLLILKVDEETREPLIGARFKISKPDMPGSERVYVTNDYGAIFLPDQDVNAYVIQEIAAPSGYILNETPYTVQLNPGERKEITLPNQAKPGITILKVDEGTNTPLPGAKFRVTKTDGITVGEYVTGSDGKIFIPNLEENIYTIEEISAPAGYVLNPQKKTVRLEAGKATQIVFSNTAKPGIQIYKWDQDTKEPLANAKFKIRKADGSTIGEYITDVQGRIFAGDLDAGIYTVMETEAPEGYLLDAQAKNITLEPGKTAYLSFSNRAKPEMSLIKTDELTGGPLAGAVFHISRQGGKDLGSFTTDENGQVNLGKLDPGVYVIEEIKAPDGYAVTNLPMEIQLGWGERKEVEIRNKALSPLYIKKVDSQTGEPVSGVKFRVEKTDGEFMGEYTTDRNGFACIPELEPGYYVVTEVSVPEGYLKDSTPKTVQVKLGVPAVLEFSNTAKQGLSMKKVDAVSGEVLPGAGFRVEKISGEIVGEYVTDKNGLIMIPDMEPGDYLITETKAPEGYLLDTSTKTVHMKKGEPASVTFTNSKIAGIQIRNTVKQTGEPLRGVKFRVSELDGALIGEFTTDAQGLVYVSLEPGWYMVTEISAPDGYEIDGTPRTVEVKANAPTVVKYEDSRLSGIRIRKVDADTGKGISGVRILIKDEDNHIIGEYATDQRGYIDLEESLPDGWYKLEEIEAAPGYNLDTKVKTVKIENGKTKEIRWENSRTKGQIQVIKKSLDDNPYTNKPAGSVLEGAIFEISQERSGKVVGYMTSDYRGVAASDPLPIGRYILREVTPPKYYALNPREFEVELKVKNDIVKVEVYNESLKLETTIQKTGNHTVQGGTQMRYDFSNICNHSSVPLQNFYFHDNIPTGAVTLNAIHTGTWNQMLTYRIVYRTNKNTAWRTLAEGLSTTQGYDIDCSGSRMGFAWDEYITEFRFEFGEVKAGFREMNKPMILVTVSGRLPNGSQFANRADCGGQYYGQWITAASAWVTRVYSLNNISYPKTGY